MITGIIRTQEEFIDALREFEQLMDKSILGSI
jgi:hypothetical protein